MFKVAEIRKQKARHLRTNKDIVKHGFLSSYFIGVAAKRLVTVEVTGQSNQHELNGTEPLRTLLGTNAFKEKSATFIWLGGENEEITEQSWISWYDSRKNQMHRASEWRLYYPPNPVMELAQPGNLLIIGRRPNDHLMLIVVSQGTTLTLENQLIWLFGLDADLDDRDFKLTEFDDDGDRELDFAALYILDELGVGVEEPEAERLDRLIANFQTALPTTREFSAFARETLSENVSPQDDPDGALLAWLTHEEALFRRMERQIISDGLSKGFVNDAGDGFDVDGFVQFSLSIQNRRKSRMGFALEHHLEEIFRKNDIRYVRGATTENRARPDFLFPGSDEYHDPDFPAGRLSMLGAKSTCKDRWRQVLSEANRIACKHLLTLEPGISEPQTREMQSNQLRLVVPGDIHKTYSDSQRRWLMTTSDFLVFVRNQQNQLPA